MQGSRSNRWARRLGYVLAPVAAAATLATSGCGGGKSEPVTPPVADPAQAKTLAGRYEPDLVLEKEDEFWPVSVLTIDRLQSGDRGSCLALERGAPCDSIATSELPWDSGPEKAYIDYPAANADPEAQHDEVAQALGSGAPGTGAQLYFYVTGRSRERPISLQYWFYYPYNYLQARILGHSVLNTDLHEGDFEGISILLSARTHRPVYVWMPRHTGEGERFAWNEGALKRNGDHPVGYVARGSHATYESCGQKFRTAPFHMHAVNVPDDYISCSPGASYELGSTVPVVNMARTWWACWPGHFGYAPGFGEEGPSGEVRSQFAADGPRSPLFQQKFQFGSPRPCAGVDPPARGAAGRELLADPDTARALGVGGGRLNDLFRSCDDWSQRPPEGSYLVACDPATLESFFESGLEDPGRQDLRVLGDPAPTGPAVPAVFASSKPDAVDRAVIRTRQVAHPEVYVAVRDGNELQTAEFPPFELNPGEKLQLRRPERSEWQLVDLAGRGRVVASARVTATELATPPKAPAITAAVRRGAEIELSFSGGADPATRLVAFAGANRRDLVESGRLVGAVRGDPSGEYRLTVADPEHAIHVLRVVASRDGALAASPLAAVSEGP